MTRRLEAVVHGRVQGVGFRYHAAREAARHGIDGWVANEPDGTVRVVGEGDEPSLRAWLLALRDGPSGASVSRVDETWSDAVGAFTGFEVRSGWHRGD
ncbi:MAG TPA: acylphosphatase [Candidatus Limnocylindrales bacterium]|nr:acylphosphatase [Candidatus Limnocylindrales bacterium]